MKSVTTQLIKNLVTSYAGMVLGVAITFFFTPYFVSSLGKEQYGIWTLLFSIIIYMEMIDLGMRQSIVRFISKHYATKDWLALNTAFSSSVRVYLIIGGVFFLCTLVMAFWFIESFQIPAEQQEVARMTLLILGTSTALNFIQLPHSSLGPYHRFDLSFYVTFTTKIAQTLGMVVLLESGYGLIEMALLILVLQAVSRLIMGQIRRTLIPEVRFSWSLMSGPVTWEMLRYAVSSFLLAATWIIIYQSDNIIIGRFLSVEAVAVFAIASQLMMQVRSAVYGIATPIVPTISHLEAERSFARIVRLYEKSTRYLYYCAGFAGVGLFLLGGPFILLWVGQEFRESITVLHLLIVPTMIAIPQTIANSVLLGISRQRVALYVVGAEAVSKITLAIILAQSYGLVGVALGTAIPQIIIYGAIYPVLFYRTIGAPVRQFYREAARSLILALLFTLPIGWLSVQAFPANSWGTLFIHAALLGAAMLVGIWLFILKPEDKERVTSRIPNFIRRRFSTE